MAVPLPAELPLGGRLRRCESARRTRRGARRAAARALSHRNVLRGRSERGTAWRAGAGAARMTCPETADYVAELARTRPFDFVHVEGYFLMHHVPDDVGLPVFLAKERTSSTSSRRPGRSSPAPADRPHWTVSRALEQQAWDRAAACGAVTPHDVAVIRDHRRDDLVHWLRPAATTSPRTTPVAADSTGSRPPAAGSSTPGARPGVPAGMERSTSSGKYGRASWLGSPMRNWSSPATARPVRSLASTRCTRRCTCAGRCRVSGRCSTPPTCTSARSGSAAG